MNTAEQFLVLIGNQTADAMKILTSAIVLDRSSAQAGRDHAIRLAAAVANQLFLTPSPDPEAQRFAASCRAEISAVFSDLSIDSEYCLVLSGAMYNFSYGRYLETGHKIGLFVHPFLGFVRALNAFYTGRGTLELAHSFRPSVGAEAMSPLLQLCQLDLYRTLPNSPDARSLYEQVLRLAAGRGYGALFV